MPYLGNEPAVAYTSTTKDSFSGDGSTTDFTMSKSANVNAVRVVVENVVQNPTVAYTCSGTTISFTSAPPTGTSNIYVVHLGPPAATVAPPTTINNATTYTADLTVDDGADILTASKGTDNVRLGENAGNSIESGGTNNVVIGKNAGTAITTADHNTAVGHQAGEALTTGARSTLVGYASGAALIDPDRNVAFGYGSLQSDTKGTKSTAIGYSALNTQNFSSATDSHNTAVGYTAAESLTTGANNTFVGSLAGDAITTSNSNTAIGKSALSAETSSNGNTAVGEEALASQNVGGSGDARNTAVGLLAGQDISTGQQNVFVGALAGSNATSVDDTVCVGYYAGGNGTMTGHDNVCVGAYAGYNVTAGRNVLVGRFAGASNIYLTSGVANVLIGDNVRVNAAAMSNAIVMGELVTGTGNNAFTFGNGATDSNIDFGATSITAPSDERYKEEIATSTAGLSFINDLRPVTFKWKKAKDVPSDHEAYIADGEEGCDDRVMLSNGETNHGFIAQEVKTAIDAHSEIKDGFRMWSEDYREDEDGKALADGRQRVAPSELVPILTKAIQELSTKNDALETENTAIKARLDALEAG